MRALHCLYMSWCAAALLMAGSVAAPAAWAEPPQIPTVYSGSAPSGEATAPLGEAAPPRLMLRDPGELRGERMPAIVVTRREESQHHKWLYGLGALCLLVAFYLTTRGRDSADADVERSESAKHKEES